MQNDSRDWNIAFHSTNNVASELLKQLKRDTPFDSVDDLVATHTQIHNKLMENYREFSNSLVNGVPSVKEPIPTDAEVKAAFDKLNGATSTPDVETPAAQPTPTPTPAPTPAAQPAPAVKTAPPVTPATPESIKTAINMAIDSANTAETLSSVKERVLKATKISLEDQAAFISKVDEKIGKLPH